MVRSAALPSSLLLALLLNPLSSFASSSSSQPFSKRATTALEALIAGPVTYVNTACTTICAPMVAQSTTCIDDVCSCAASAQTVTCMNCLLSGSGTAAQALIVENGFNVYAQDCVDQGELAVIPTLITPVAVTSTSSLSSSTRSSASSSSSAARTSTTAAVAGGTTTGYTAIAAWYAAVDGTCPANCATVEADIAACTTDACVCTQAIFNDGQTCQTQCVVNNIQGAFGATEQTTIATLWTRAQTACGITAAGAAAAVTTATSTGARTATGGIPQQSFYAPTATTSGTTSGVVAQATGGSSGSTSSAFEERAQSSWVVGFFGLVGAVLLV
ncbi:hypothetical protein BDY24DRAFT_390600 [Mrakia frigida]|uniref:uncharacterized protein n=1 Tax=Mrakia frigida TaxID=29902 RepID=UPI003FCBF7C2